MAELRYRLTRVIEVALVDYLETESEWQPELHTEHLDDKVTISIKYPPASNISSFQITIIEKTNV